MASHAPLDDTGNGEGPLSNGEDFGPQVGVISQYVKDLSFENPNAPAVYQWQVQPQIDVQTLTVAPVIGLSHSSDARLPQTWIALLREQLTVSLAGTSGVETASDLVAYLLAGADVVECASAFLRNGIEYATLLLDGLDAWGNEHGFRSVEELRGRLAVPWNVDPQEYTREGYVAALQTARRSYLHL